MRTAKVIIEVQAGVIPEQADPERTCRWTISSDEWEAAAGDWPILLAERVGQAQGYAALLAQPQLVNWVRLDWIYL